MVVGKPGTKWTRRKCGACQANLLPDEELMVVNSYGGYGSYGRGYRTYKNGERPYHRHCVELWLKQTPYKQNGKKPNRIVREEEIEAEFNKLRDQLADEYGHLLTELAKPREKRTVTSTKRTRGGK